MYVFSTIWIRLGLTADRIFKLWIWPPPHGNDSNFCRDSGVSSELYFPLCFGSRPSIAPSSLLIPFLQRPPRIQISTQLPWLHVQFCIGQVPRSLSSFRKGDQRVDERILLEGSA